MVTTQQPVSAPQGANDVYQSTILSQIDELCAQIRVFTTNGPDNLLTSESRFTALKFVAVQLKFFPGMVGLICAQSVGEPTAQTLNTFHHAVAIKVRSKHTRGLPRPAVPRIPNGPYFDAIPGRRSCRSAPRR